MKKSVQFSGSASEQTSYLTAVLSFQCPVQAAEIQGMVEDSVQFLALPTSQDGSLEIYKDIVRYTDKVKVCQAGDSEVKILFRARYFRKHADGSEAQADFEVVRSDANYLVEQVEALVAGFATDAGADSEE